MTSKALFDAIDAIDEKYIVQAQEDVKVRIRQKRQRWLAACACLAVALGVGLSLPAVLSPELEDSQGQLADISYGFYLNGLEYQPMEVMDHAKYPALQQLQFSGTKEQVSEIMESLYLGEQIGTVAADENFGEGTVYRVRQYPTYDSIVIMYRDGAYVFYVSDGNSLHRYTMENDDRSSSSIFAFHGFPERILTAKTDLLSEQTLDSETVASLIEIMNGKEEASYTVYAQRTVALWQSRYGTDEVRLNETGTGLDYDVANKDVRERLWQLTTPQPIWIATDRGFDELLIHYYPQLSMFSFCRVLYELTPDEVSAIDALLSAP
ncbi:MAG: hypothetical protein IJY66_07780 [Clostridia bacterium]|nr:hypothetical protein [Clostridia bacterium]